MCAAVRARPRDDVSVARDRPTRGRSERNQSAGEPSGLKSTIHKPAQSLRSSS